MAAVLKLEDVRIGRRPAAARLRQVLAERALGAERMSRLEGQSIATLAARVRGGDEQSLDDYLTSQLYM